MKKIFQRPQAVYLQQNSNQQGRPVQIVQNRQIQPQGGQQQVVTSQRVQIIRPGSQQPTQYVVRLTPQQQQQRQVQSVQQQGVRCIQIMLPLFTSLFSENTPNSNSSTAKITTTSSIPPRSKPR